MRFKSILNIPDKLSTGRQSIRAAFSAMRRNLASQKKAVWLSCASAAILIVLSYYIDSTPYPIGGEMTIGQWIERLRKICIADDDNVPDSICLINVAYDKTLADYEAPLYSGNPDSPTLYAGKITTTDRHKLLQFLNIADSLKNYRYILLDIRFENGIETDSVSLELFSLINRMKNIVFAIHENDDITPEAPLDKAAYADYHTTFLVTDVVKYPLLKQSKTDPHYVTGIPAKIYSDLTGTQFSSSGWLTYADKQLCLRSIYPTFPVRISSWARESKATHLPILQYYNLGEDLVNTPDSRKNISNLINNRIVVIGDFIDDIHDTYVGQQPGALVNLNAYIALTKGQHLVNIWGVLFQFIMYFVITWFIITKKKIADIFPKLRRPSSIIIRFILSFVGFTLILTIAAAIIYIAFGTIFSIAFPTIYFTVLQTCIER